MTGSSLRTASLFYKITN